MKKLIFTVAIAMTTLASLAQSGSLDNTFGTGGKVITGTGGESDVCKSMAIQSDGKLVMAGYSYNGTNKDFSLIRLNTNGTLDKSFGTEGKVITAIGNADDFGSSVAIQSDGKIVLVGYSFIGTGNVFVLVRYNSSGLLDNTFGIGGKVITNIGNDANAYSVSIQSDGKIVVAGISTLKPNWSDFTLARYLNNGILDNTFGAGGIVITDIGNNTPDECNSTAIQIDGKIVVSGYSFSGNTNFVSVRYNNNGVLDTTFGTAGKVITNVAQINYSFSIAIQNDGKIVAAGWAFDQGTFGFALVRYHKDGTLDTTFGIGGKVITKLANRPKAYAVAIQSDGKIVVFGYQDATGSKYFVLARYNTNGTLDNFFGTGGIVFKKIGGVSVEGSAIVIQNDGKIVVSGTCYPVSATDYVIERFNSDGTLDNSFGNGGMVTVDLESHDDFGSSVTIQNDGKIVMVGSAKKSSTDYFAVIRYRTTGLLDSAFGVGGKVLTKFSSNFNRASSVALQSNDKIVVAGSTYNGTKWNFALVRYNTNGNVDYSFAPGGGGASTAIGIGADYGVAVAIQPDDKIVIAGQTYNGADIDFAIVRYDSTGNLDNTFGAVGKVTTAIVGSGDDKANAITIQSDGKILVAGESDKGGNYDFALVRYNTDGTLDNSFGTGGKVLTAIGNADDKGKSVVIQKNDGKIIVAGSSNNGTNDNFALVRYNTDGSLDNTFGNGGKVTTAIGSSGDAGYSVALMSDGKIVVGGESNNGTNYDFALARYNTNGTLDNSFGNGGKVTTAIGSGSDEGFSIAIQNDGKIVLAGTSYNGFDNDFSLARYNNYNTGIAETLSGQFSISPNPTNGIFYLHQDATTNEMQTIEIYNVLGEKIYSKASNHQVTDAIDISGSPDGIYFVKIFEGDLSCISKVVKQ